jgi:hypothetical protein
MIAVTDPGFRDLTLHVLAPRTEAFSVELQFEAPACFDGDTRYVAIPSSWTAALSPDTRRRVVPSERAKEITERCDSTVDRDRMAWVGLPAPELTRRPPGEPRIGVTVARFSDGKGSHQAARVELAIAKTLGEIPRDLDTVFVVDASRSMQSYQRDDARALVRSYLAHAPSSSVQVVAFAREAKALLDHWTSAASASGMVDTELEQLAARNGSEVQRGLHEAGAWLRRTGGTRRVVLITDELVADRVAKLSASTLAAELPLGTLVHVIAISGGNQGLERDDGARWSALAAATEGIAMRGVADASGVLDALPLVRPTALDHVRITAPSWSALDAHQAACLGPDPDAPRALEEGRSCTWWGTSSAGDTIDVEGLIWGHRWHRTIPLGDRANIELARQLRFVLDGTEPLAIAALDAARAVSKRWSLVGRWGGDGGYADAPANIGPGWGSTCDCGGHGTFGHGSGSGSVGVRSPSLRDQLALAVGGCMRDGVAIDLTVETTVDEIVDVEVKAAPRTGRGALADKAAIETCVTEAVWNTDIQLTPSVQHETSRLTY